MVNKKIFTKLGYLLVLLAILGFIAGCGKLKTGDISIKNLELDTSKINANKLAVKWQVEHEFKNEDVLLDFFIEIKDGTSVISNKVIAYNKDTDFYAAEFSGLTEGKLYEISITATLPSEETVKLSVSGFPASALGGRFTITTVEPNKVTWPFSPSIDGKAAGYIIKLEEKDRFGSVVSTQYKIGCIPEYKFSFCQVDVVNNNNQLSYTVSATGNNDYFLTITAFNFGNYSKSPIVNNRLAEGSSPSGAVGGNAGAPVQININKKPITGGSLVYSTLSDSQSIPGAKMLVAESDRTTKVSPPTLDKTTINPVEAQSASFIYSIVSPPAGFSINPNSGELTIVSVENTPQSNYIEVRATIDSPTYQGYLKTTIQVEIDKIAISGGSLAFPGLNVNSATYPGAKRLIAEVNTSIMVETALDKTTINPAEARSASFTYSIVNPPEGISIDPNSGKITIKPVSTTPQNNYIEVRATIVSPIYKGGNIKVYLEIQVGNGFYENPNFISFVGQTGNAYNIKRIDNDANSWSGTRSFRTLAVGKSITFKPVANSSFYIGLSKANNGIFTKSDMYYRIEFSNNASPMVYTSGSEFSVSGNNANSTYRIEIVSDGVDLYVDNERVIQNKAVSLEGGKFYVYIAILEPKNNTGYAITDFKVNFW